MKVVADMKAKTIVVKDAAMIQKIIRIVEDKKYVDRKIREGKFSEIAGEVKLVQPVQ